MSRTTCRLAILILCATGLAPVMSVHAQSYGDGARWQRPLYPYELQPGQAYAVEVAPGAHVIHHPSNRGGYSTMGRRVRHAAPRYRAARQAEKHKSSGQRADKTINTRQIVREKPRVIETRRVVNDPPKVVERRHYVDDVPVPPRRRHVAKAARKRADKEGPRVIRAEAEITILGPDRMSIRLVRKDGKRFDLNARSQTMK
jgi:hypothetical protein